MKKISFVLKVKNVFFEYTCKRKPQVKRTNNKTHIELSDRYHDAFSNFNWPEILISYKTIHLKTTSKIFYAIQPTPNDPLVVPVGPITRVMVKKFKEAFNRLLQDTWMKVDYKRATTKEEQSLINLIHI